MRALITAVAATAISAIGPTFVSCENGPVHPECCEPGDQLNLIMEPHGDPNQRCQDMGGTLERLTCEDVDF